MGDSLKRLIRPATNYFNSAVDVLLALAILFICYQIAGAIFGFGEKDADTLSQQAFSKSADGNAAGVVNFEILNVTSPFGTEAPDLGRKLAEGPVAITKLDLQLKGVRLNKTGLSSAIVKVEDQPEQSYVVGATLLPGVTLKAVYFDRIQITHSGVFEQLYLDGAKPKTLNQQ